MVRFTKKHKKRILFVSIFIILTILILKLFDLYYYKVDMSTLSQKSILYYKNSDSNNSYIIAKFMKYISNEDYEEAFELLEKNNKKDMFNNDAEEFMNKMKCFSNSYSKLDYNTIFVKEYEKYIDEDIICVISNADDEIEHSIRFNVRTYTKNKEANIIILSIS